MVRVGRRRWSIAMLASSGLLAAVCFAHEAHADLVASFSFDPGPIEVTQSQPITLDAVLTVSSSSTEDFLTGPDATLLSSTGVPISYLSTVAPLELWPQYTIDETPFIDTISNLDVAPGQSVSFTYGVLYPTSPIAPGTYDVPQPAPPGLNEIGDAWIYAATYCPLDSCDIISGPFIGPSNSAVITIGASVPEPPAGAVFLTALLALPIALRLRPRPS